eukprot:TRINITY_DN7590_c1_g1_i2.p4 TRINITY_DN7590_c1_g1~~TRINITY_DN7590_c1_g1_i2.p4  ORF type:complete len:257 (+),score=19.51 TRINITY_DN7590_c1_g1_i2:918-1688(+)
MIETCLKCVSLVWFVLLVAVANAQTSSLILSNLEDATTTNLIESQQSSDQPLIAECQLLLTVMKSTCEVTTIQGLTLQSEEKILNCCNIATQILENDCYEPCEDSQTIDLWLKPICQLNVTTDCQTAAQNESASSQNVEFRAARTEQNLAYEPSVSGGQSSTLVLDYTDSAEDFAMQLEQWPDFGCEGIKVQRAHQPTSQEIQQKKIYIYSCIFGTQLHFSEQAYNFRYINKQNIQNKNKKQVSLLIIITTCYILL